MKYALILLTVFFATNALADSDFNCEDSAVTYITTIASAPYVKHGGLVQKKDLNLVSRKKMGDGAESFEHYVYTRNDSNETYRLQLYVEEVGGTCPLEKFEVARK